MINGSQHVVCTFDVEVIILWEEIIVDNHLRAEVIKMLVEQVDISIIINTYIHLCEEHIVTYGNVNEITSIH